MTELERKTYYRNYFKKNRLRMRSHKMKWYCKNRKMLNMLISAPKGPELDEADKWYEEKHLNQTQKL